MIRSIFSILFLFLFPVNYSSGNEYRGTIIDAHSQWGCEFPPKVIFNAIKKRKTDHTLLSVRCAPEKGDPVEIHLKLAKLVESMGRQANMLLSLKYKDAATVVKLVDSAYFNKSVGFSEIIVQHAIHVHQHLKISKARDHDLESSHIVKLIDFIARKKVPIILHIELNDFESKSAMILRQLKDLLKKYPKHKFVLIHMGQANVDEARNLIEEHKNIFFLTSQADAFSVVGIRRLEKRGEKAQFGWINMFTDPSEKAPYKGWAIDYRKTFSWRKDWENLIKKYPDRFIFAIDSIFKPHWGRRYRAKLKLWKKAFSLLPPEVAIQVACKNAASLWKIDVSCALK
ncbi:MAG: amidohydrolase family protein [Pseudomonadota bacterium]|nr:amidohydrolase family protein [Pseudomonadota bacterium]